MTNEEKAHRICETITSIYGVDIAQEAHIYSAVLAAMEWKDEQMKEALNNILIECDACFDVQTTTTLQVIINHQISIL